MRRVVPLRRRPLDVVLVGFFAVNLLVISYVVDLEQLVIADPESFSYPIWPPPAAVDLVHWWGHHYDPTLMAREPWWKATIWIDQILFGPFYAAAIWALWWTLPVVVVARFARSEHPFTQEVR